MRCRRLHLGLAPTFPSDRPVSLLPQRHPITGTNLFGVLEKACRSGDDPTGQSAEEEKKLSVEKISFRIATKSVSHFPADM